MVTRLNERGGVMNKIAYSGLVKLLAFILLIVSIVGGILAIVGGIRTFLIRRKDHE